MQLQDVFDQLTAGEFSQLAIGGQERGIINTSNFKQVIAHINMGLTALYRRFSLKEGHLVVSLQPGQLTYPLKSDYAVANRRSRQPIRFILDSAHAPFEDDIHKIERVVTENGYELALNDVSNPLACGTPSMTTLTVPSLIVDPTSQTPEWLRTHRLNVYYRANHPIISIPIGYFDPKRVEVELPYAHLEALLYFVASRANNPIGMTDEFHAGNNYTARFEAACRELEAMNMRIDVGQQGNKLRDKGFV